MAGPIENLAPGNSWVTAWAMHVRRRVAQHVAALVGVGRDDRHRGAVGQRRDRGPHSSPLTTAATAALASREPIDSATVGRGGALGERARANRRAA